MKLQVFRCWERKSIPVSLHVRHVFRTLLSQTLQRERDNTKFNSESITIYSCHLTLFRISPWNFVGNNPTWEQWNTRELLDYGSCLLPCLPLRRKLNLHNFGYSINTVQTTVGLLGLNPILRYSRRIDRCSLGSML